MSRWHEYALPALLLLPLLAAVVLLVSGSRADRWATGFGVRVQGVGLLVALAVLAGFDVGESGTMQFTVDAQWVDQLDLSIRLGVDGISLPLVVLTSLLGLLTTVYSIRFLPEPGHPRAFIGLLLLLQVGMLGTFISLDLILFFIAFEVVLVPMWFLIAVWGDGKSGLRRTHSSSTRCSHPSSCCWVSYWSGPTPVQPTWCSSPKLTGTAWGRPLNLSRCC